MTRFFLPGAALLGSLTLAAAAGHATVVQGTGSFSDNGPAGNGLIFSGSTDNSALGNGINLTVGTPVTLNSFLTITSNDSNDAFFGQAGATDNISESFTFTHPSSGSGAVNGQGQETTDAFFGVIDGVSGNITWNNPGTVNFSDGAVLQVSLSSASFDPHGGPDQTLCVDATFDLVDPPSVPEPASLALLGSGLFGLGLATRRRRKTG